MMNLLGIQVGDIVEYRPYLWSKELEDERFTGAYQGFDFWAPDERPAELWIELIKHQEPMKGKRARIRASQVTNVWRGQAGYSQKEKQQNGK